MTQAATPIDIDQARVQAQETVRASRDALGSLDQASLDLLFRKARSHYAWQDRPVEETTLRELYALTAQGPTSMNCSPARFFFVQSNAAKDRLAKSLKPKNVPKVLSAPVTVIIANELAFWERLDYLFPHEDRKPMFRGKEAHIADTAYRNATLQGAWMMMAARALGLDCGPVSGFSNAVVDEEFFAGTTLQSNFLLNLGYGDVDALFPKLPRLPFEEACTFL